MSKPILKRFEELHRSLGRKANLVGMYKAEYRCIRQEVVEILQDPRCPQDIQDEGLDHLSSLRESIEDADEVQQDALEKMAEVEEIIQTLKGSERWL